MPPSSHGGLQGHLQHVARTWLQRQSKVPGFERTGSKHSGEAGRGEDDEFTLDATHLGDPRQATDIQV